MADLQERISKTIEILESVKEEDVNGKEDEEVIFKTRTAELKFTGLSEFETFLFAIRLVFGWNNGSEGGGGEEEKRIRRATTD